MVLRLASTITVMKTPFSVKISLSKMSICRVYHDWFIIEDLTITTVWLVSSLHVLPYSSLWCPNSNDLWLAHCWKIEVIWVQRGSQKILQSHMPIQSCQLPWHGVSRCLNKILKDQTCWIGEVLLAGVTACWLTWELASTTAFLEQHFPITTPHYYLMTYNNCKTQHYKRTIEHFNSNPRLPMRLTWECSALDNCPLIIWIYFALSCHAVR